MEPDPRRSATVRPSAAECLEALTPGDVAAKGGDIASPGNIRDRMDPEVRAVLESSPHSLQAMALSGKKLSEKRQAMDALCDQLLASMAPNDRVIKRDRMIPGPQGGPDVRVRIYRPADQTAPLPGLCWMHGGGMTMGKPELCERLVSSFVERVGCVAVSVDYRLAPEHPHPAPVGDCYAALSWIAQHADELGIDVGRLAIGGESAGGGLAAATALMARDKNGPALIFQLLIYPMLDDRNATRSSHEITDVGVWDRQDNIDGWAALLGNQAQRHGVSPYAAPARSEDLSSLPPAYIDVGELDVFRDEDVQYAMRLRHAGIPAELHVYPGVFHGWEVVVPKAGVTKRAVAQRREALRRALHPDRGAT